MKNKRLIVLVAVLAAVAVGSVGYSYHLKKSEIKSKIDSRKDMVLSVPEDTSWKEYKSEKLGISFQYPAKYGKVEEKTEVIDPDNQIKFELKGETTSVYLGSKDVYFSVHAESKDYDPGGTEFGYVDFHGTDSIPSLKAAVEAQYNNRTNPFTNKPALPFDIYAVTTESGEKGFYVLGDALDHSDMTCCQEPYPGEYAYYFNLKNKVYGGAVITSKGIPELGQMIQTLKIY